MLFVTARFTCPSVRIKSMKASASALCFVPFMIPVASIVASWPSSNTRVWYLVVSSFIT